MFIHFTKYANDKFEILARHECAVRKEDVELALNAPETVDESKAPYFIAQRGVGGGRQLRVVYKKEAGVFKVITFYPAGRTNE